MKTDATLIDCQNLPKHIGIILDGNGRWAAKHGLPRYSGHLKGAKNIQKIVEAASELGIKCLSLFCFSTENWQRPQNEVNYLMNLAKDYLTKLLKRDLKNPVRIRFIGEKNRLSAELLELMQRVMVKTSQNQGMEVVVALDYGSQQEIVRTTQKIVQAVLDQKIQLADITPEVFEQFLDTKGLPPIDLLIRTSGEERLSNFLLWQNAYSEFYFPKTYWPAFHKKDLIAAISEYQHRNRRFGK